MTAKAAELIRRIDLFADLDEHELAKAAELSEVRSFPRDAAIFDAGAEGDTVFVVGSGKVKITVTSPGGKELILAVLGEGQVFGEMALLESAPRSASAVTETAVELLALQRREFNRLLDSEPAISRKLLAILSQRLRRANARMESLAYMDVAGRLARFFLELARDHGQRLGNGWVAVRRPTHADIANSIGTSRETVSRIINEFEDRLGMANKGRFTYIREDLLD